MSTIGMPVNGESFFPFVQGSPTENRTLTMFPTFAHLLTAAAGIGSALNRYLDSPSIKELDPRPIDASVFRHQQLIYPLMAFVILHAGDPIIIEQEAEFTRIAEGLAAGGFEEMNRRLDKVGNSNYWPDEWEKIIKEVLAQSTS